MADSEQVQCQFCKGTYKKRGLAYHQRSCKQKQQDAKPGQGSELSPDKVSPAERRDKKQSDTVQCEYCGRAFKKGGLATHQRSCKQKPQDLKQQHESSDLQAGNILPAATSEQEQEQSNTRQCQYCSGTYTKKGLANHQRACKQKHMDHGEDSETLTGGSVFSERVTDPVQAYNTLATSEQKQSNTRQCQYCSGTFTKKGLANHQRACKQKHMDHEEDSETLTGGSVFSERVTDPVQTYNTLSGRRYDERQESGLGLGSKKSMPQMVKYNTRSRGSSSSIPSEIDSGALNSDLPPMRFLSPKDRIFLNKEIKNPIIWPVIAADIRWDGSAERKREPCDVVLSAVGESFLEMLKLFRRVEQRAHVDMKKSLKIIYNARILEASFEKLKRHTPEIISGVDPKDVYLRLYADRILTFHDKDEIERACTKSMRDGCTILLNKISLCPVEKDPIPKLCNALREQNCKHMADLLELSSDDIEPKEP